MVKYDLILHGKKEFNNIYNNNKKYKVLKVDNKKKEKFMIKIFNKFIENQNKFINEQHFLGIDLEYNKVSKTNRDIALMQLNLENNNKKAYIFILFPPDMEKENLEILINLLTNIYIIKILHGGDPLDIPYLFDQLLITKINIDNYCKNFYDTKYLCDFKFKNNCSIYKLLLKTNIINDKKYDELDKIEDIIGPIYLIDIDIYNLDENVLKYSLYDVLYLPELIKYFINLDIEYSNIISDISGLVSKFKRNIETHFINLEKIINIMNLFTINIENRKYKLCDLWNIYFIYFDEFILLNDINYFKGFIKIIKKFILYINIYNKFKIYNSKNQEFTYNFNNYLKWLSNYKYLNNIINYNFYIFKNDIDYW